MKKNFTLKSIFTLLVLLYAMNTYSQERTCGMLDHMEKQMQNPEFAKAYEKSQKKFKAKLQQLLSEENFSQRGRALVEIPVAVHFPTANEADRECLVALAQNQIDILNADYTATNADISLWNSVMGFYPGTNLGVANISFCLAESNHPVGLDPELLEGEPCVTIGYNFGNGNFTDSNWGGYMNFVVRPIDGGVLGFSPLGGRIGAGQAVTINTDAFGSGSGCSGSGVVPSAPFNLGRTTTHELGHFYNLNHTFNADGGGVCGSGGDGIADTPEVANSTYFCPPDGSVAGCVAGQSALTMSYMDYGDDRCLYMFSAGQATVMDAWVSSIESQIKPDVCTPAVPGFNITADNSPIPSCPATDTQVVFDLFYRTIQGFSETTTFSASGVPAGATVAFSPTSLNSDGYFIMTLGNLGATTEGEYAITVTGASNSVTESRDVVLSNNCVEVVCDDYTATDTPIEILAAAPPVSTYTSTITITEDLPVDNINVTLTIQHDWIRDIIATITSPNGTEVELTSVNGENGAGQYLNTTFDQEATNPISEGVSPFAGTFVPEGDLSIIYGEMSAGDWVLTITDNFANDGGFLNNFEIELCLESPLSISEFELNGFSIFPNPNKGEFTIKLNSNSGNDINIDVFDMRGRRIFNNSFTNGSDFNQTINLNNAKSGMYLVTISDGTSKTIKKIIVE